MDVPPVTRIDDNHPWIWRPPHQAQSLQALQAAGITSVVGTKRCNECGYVVLEELDDLAGRFAALREVLQQNRDEVIQYRLATLQEHDFVQTSITRPACPNQNCRRRQLQPVVPEPPTGKVKGRPYNPHQQDQIIDQMNLMYFFLGGHFKYCPPELLLGLLTRFGLPRETYNAMILQGHFPKPVYIVALNYCLARLLDPENQLLRLHNGWPIGGRDWYQAPN